MGEFFLDESIRENGGFIVGAFVYCERDPTPAVHAALVKAGMRSLIEEYKSGSSISSHPKMFNLRADLCSLVQDSKIGLLVMPYEHRSQLGNEALLCLNKILSANQLDQIRHTIYFDTGIIPGNRALDHFREQFGQICELRLNQDSKIVGGLQLADLTAHYLGTMLLAQRGKVSKKVRAGESSGYPLICK
jgi:hypothetical protein